MSFNVVVFSIFGFGGNFVQPNRTILAILVSAIRETLLWNYLKIRPLAVEEMSFKGFSIFSSGRHFVQPSGTILTISVEGHRRNTSLQIF